MMCPDKKIDQDQPDETLCVEMVQTDRLVLPFTKPGDVPFLAAPTAFIMEDPNKPTVIKKLELGAGLTINDNVLTMTVEGSDLDCYIEQEVFIVMAIVNQGRRDAIIKLTVKYNPV